MLSNMTGLKRKEMICVVCPVGCKLSIEKTSDGYRIKGNECKRGEEYAIKEFTHPTRMLTSTVKIKRSLHKRLPVHSSEPLPKNKLFDAMEIINACSVLPPVKTGQIIIRNIAGTSANICASRDIEK